LSFWLFLVIKNSAQHKKYTKKQMKCSKKAKEFLRDEKFTTMNEAKAHRNFLKNSQ
jgi:hypothetical protein